MGTYTFGSKSGTVTEDSSLAEYLNGEYYNSLNQTAKGQVQIHMYNIGGIQLDQSGNDSIAKNLASEKAYTWTGNIGLPNVTDVLRASTDPLCTSVSAVVYAGGCTVNYLSEEGPWFVYFTMNGTTSSVDSADKEPWYVWNVYIPGDPMTYYDQWANMTSGVRPVLFLKSTIQITSGNGTRTQPYIISE